MFTYTALLSLHLLALREHLTIEGDALQELLTAIYHAHRDAIADPQNADQVAVSALFWLLDAVAESLSNAAALSAQEVAT